MSVLKIAALQTDLVWEDAVKNRLYFEEQFPDLALQGLDFVVLPEMFTTGFSMQLERLAETMQGKTISWMKEMAEKYNFLLTGSLIIEENGKYFNRQIFAFPDGQIQYYDKRHLFRMGGEHEYYTAGTERIIVKYKSWRILPQVCYDLRFPVWSRNRNDYDMLLYVANFPASRRYVWNTLLRARAIENQAYVVGCNRIGEDGKGVPHSGDSLIISPKGEVIAHAPENKLFSLIANLDLEELREFRQKFPVHLDADDFELK